MANRARYLSVMEGGGGDGGYIATPYGGRGSTHPPIVPRETKC